MSVEHGASRSGSEGEWTGLGRAALLLAASALLSRILGYGRDIMLAYFAGVGWQSDAYFAAFIIPDWLNYLLAGSALSIGFLPLYTRALHRGGEAEASRLLATVLGNLAIIAVAVTGLLWWQADRLIALQFPEFTEEAHRLTVETVRILLPAQVAFILGGILKATLFARGRFGAAALAPLVYNLATILGGVLLYPTLGVKGFAWGVLVGAVLGPFLAPLIDARRDGPVRMRVSWMDRDFARYLALAAPLMLGQSLLTVDEWFDKWFGGLLAQGSVAQLTYARRLMLVPVAVVGQAIATAALPALTQLWERGRKEETNATLLRALQGGASLGVMALVAFVMLAAPLVEVFYQRGAWTAEDTQIVARLLFILSLSIPAWILQQILVRGFYARGDTWRPMVLGTVIVLAAIPLYRWMALEHGITGLAWAGVLGMWVNFIATLVMARSRHGAPDLRTFAGTLARSTAFALAAGLPSLLIVRTPSWQALGSFDAYARLTLGGVLYLVLAALLFSRFGDDATRSMLGRIRAKLRSGRR
jgi:putative peptidoglycan lipid II flippase